MTAVEMLLFFICLGFYLLAFVVALVRVTAVRRV